MPNQVLAEADYAIAIDGARPRAERIAAFRRRTDWIDQELGKTDYLSQIQAMLSRYGDMGLIEARKGVAGDPDISPVIYVGDGKPPPATAGLAAGAAPPAKIAFTERLGNFPFGSRQ